MLLVCMIFSFQICSAQNVVHQIEDSMPMDKWAHMGVGYIINDQLKRYTRLTILERLAVIGGVAYAKEKWADSKFDRGDLGATVAGGLCYEVRF